MYKFSLNLEFSNLSQQQMISCMADIQVDGLIDNYKNQLRWIWRQLIYIIIIITIKRNFGRLES